jgi:hypothetical protein
VVSRDTRNAQRRRPTKGRARWSEELRLHRPVRRIDARLHRYTKYSVRTGMEAVYQLLHIERGVPEVFGSIYDGIVGPLMLVDFSCDLTPNRRYDHRDGIEPPTPAFSGPPSKRTKRSGISGDD